MTPGVKICIDRFGALAERIPQALRFIVVGCLGLLTDLGTFTAIAAYSVHPLVARLISLGIATFVTWRLNRALTFARSNRAQSDEAMRYMVVTAVAQGTSYAVFAILVFTLSGAMPQAALLCGAIVGAVVSYHGHRLFAFAPATARHAMASRNIAAAGSHRA